MGNCTSTESEATSSGQKQRRKRGTDRSGGDDRGGSTRAPVESFANISASDRKKEKKGKTRRQPQTGRNEDTTNRDMMMLGVTGALSDDTPRQGSNAPSFPSNLSRSGGSESGGAGIVGVPSMQQQDMPRGSHHSRSNGEATNPLLPPTAFAAPATAPAPPPPPGSPALANSQKRNFSDALLENSTSVASSSKSGGPDEPARNLNIGMIVTAPSSPALRHAHPSASNNDSNTPHSVAAAPVGTPHQSPVTPVSSTMEQEGDTQQTSPVSAEGAMRNRKSPRLAPLQLVAEAGSAGSTGSGTDAGAHNVRNEQAVSPRRSVASPLGDHVNHHVPSNVHHNRSPRLSPSRQHGHMSPRIVRASPASHHLPATTLGSDDHDDAELPAMVLGECCVDEGRVVPDAPASVLLPASNAPHGGSRPPPVPNPPTTSSGSHSSDASAAAAAATVLSSEHFSITHRRRFDSTASSLVSKTSSSNLSTFGSDGNFSRGTRSVLSPGVSPGGRRDDVGHLPLFGVAALGSGASASHTPSGSSDRRESSSRRFTNASRGFSTYSLDAFVDNTPRTASVPRNAQQRMVSFRGNGDDDDLRSPSMAFMDGNDDGVRRDTSSSLVSNRSRQQSDGSIAWSVSPQSATAAGIPRRGLVQHMALPTFQTGS